MPSKVLLTEPIFIPRFGMNQPGMQSDILAPPGLQMKWAAEWDMLAQVMKSAMGRSVPELLRPGQWHLPWIRDWEWEAHDLHTLQQLSVARSARLSYKPFDGTDDLDRELERYEKLVVSSPVHASPAEHQATPDELKWGTGDRYNEMVWKHEELHGNLHGWCQYRKTLPNESVREY